MTPRTLALLGIVLALVGTVLVYLTSETKGQPARYGPSPGTPQWNQMQARMRLYRIGSLIGYALIVVGLGLDFVAALSSR